MKIYSTDYLTLSKIKCLEKTKNIILLRIFKIPIEHGIFSDKTITDIKEDYNWSKGNDKHYDFDLEI